MTHKGAYKFKLICFVNYKIHMTYLMGLLRYNENLFNPKDRF